MSHDIRIVVPCFDSDLTVEECISSVFLSEGADFELYAVDDGNNKKLYSLQNKFSFSIIKTTGREGAGRARNLGTLGFKGRIVIFIDSDVSIIPSAVALLAKPILENLAEATVGCYSKVQRRNFCESYKQFYLSCRYDTEGKYFENTFWTAISAMNYETFTRIKGFNESYSGAGPEDIEMGIKLSGCQARILSVPKACGTHLATLNFSGLLKNDLRKGSEDIFIHWKEKVPIKYNRHVNKTEIFAVFMACLVPGLIVVQFYAGLIPLLAVIILYIGLRIPFIRRAFGSEGIIFLIKAFLLTFLLDIVRGLAVVKGTLYYLLSVINPKKFKPFSKPAMEF